MTTKTRSEDLSQHLLRAGANALQHAADILLQQPELSVVTFAVGTELTMKARLAFEHWHLIVHDTKRTKGRESDLWSRLQAGQAQTVGAQKTLQLLERILLPSETAALHRSKPTLQELYELRNQAVHFGMRSEPDSDFSDLASTQLRAWHALQAVADSWPEELLETAREEWETPAASLAKLTDFLETKASELRPHLKAAQKSGTFVGFCPSCTHVGLTSPPESPSLTRADCRVCASSSFAASGPCPKCKSPTLAPVPDAEAEAGGGLRVSCVGCSFDEEVARLGEVALFVPPALAPGDPEEPPRTVRCIECGYAETTHLEVSASAVFACVPCADSWPDDPASVGPCQHCGDEWVGTKWDDQLFILGCGLCEDSIRERIDRE